jgi:hypothetical protein
MPLCSQADIGHAASLFVIARCSDALPVDQAPILQLDRSISIQHSILRLKTADPFCPSSTDMFMHAEGPPEGRGASAHPRPRISLIPCRLSGQVSKKTIVFSVLSQAGSSSFLGWPRGGQHEKKAQPILGT